jgi:putative ABC transport system permease protein
VSFLADLRVAFRTLVRAPGFFAIASGVLALGIAAVVVMSGFLRVTTKAPSLDGVDRVFALSTVDARHNEPERMVVRHDLEDWSREQKSFDAVAGYGPETVSFRREGATAERFLAGRVAGPLFDLLRVRPLLGRNLLAEDSLPGASPVVVLSERLWRSTFFADPSVIGEAVRVNGESCTVVGVAPAALDLPVSALLWFADRTDTSRAPYFWMPGRLPRVLSPSFFPIGRLRRGVAPDEARAELRSIQARRVPSFPEVATEIPDVRPLSILWMGSEYQRLLRVFLGSVLLVLALACVNVAGLLLVRGSSRTHEAAVRRALGARPLRLASQMLAEAVVIGVAAVVMALALAAGGMEVLRRVVPAALPASPAWWQVRLDGVDLLVALAIGLVAALGAGMYPAIRVARVSIDPLLREGQRDTGLHAARLVRWLIVAEIALSSALLTEAGLVMRSGARLGSGDVGVPTAGLLMGRIELPSRYGFLEMTEFIKNLTARAQGIPGVEGAAVSTAPPGIPAGRARYATFDRLVAGNLEDLPRAAMVAVGPDFFDAFRIPILQGRPFVYDPGNLYKLTSVAVVSQSFARSVWPSEPYVIGKLFRVTPEQPWIPAVTIVGVAKDVRYDTRLRSLGTAPPVIYVQFPMPSLYLTLRAPRDPLGAAEAMRQIVRELDPDVPLFSVRSLDEERRRNTAGVTLVARMFAVFGALALVLAAAGVYGVLAYSVAQGAREIAIRRALGAPRGRIVATVLARSGWQLALGLLLGLVLAPLVGALLGSNVIQLDAELTVYLEVAAMLAAVLLVSVLVPLRRAVLLEPASALRHT